VFEPRPEAVVAAAGITVAAVPFFRAATTVPPNLIERLLG